MLPTGLAPETLRVQYTEFLGVPSPGELRRWRHGNSRADELSPETMRGMELLHFCLCYLVVEGPHDVEFVYRLLNPFGLKRVRLEVDLDAAFHPLIPRNYPPDGDLQKRMPIPLFLQSTSHAIAVHSPVYGEEGVCVGSTA